MKIAVNKAHFPVTVLGPGRRIGIWLQGCSIRCQGCVSQDTWERDPGREMTVARLLTWCRKVAADGFDGVTISGGEPFDQPAALAALLDAMIHWRQSAGLDFDILGYSGYPLATLEKRHPLPLQKLWRGSANQSLVALSERGRERYAPYAEAPDERRIQASVDGEGKVWCVGIPGRGDMEALEKLCAERGVAFGEVSWRQ